MKKGKIKVGNVTVEVPIPENMADLLTLVSSEDDLFYLASRGFDQVRRTHLLSIQHNGVKKKALQVRATNYWYQHQKRFEDRPALNIPKRG